MVPPNEPFWKAPTLVTEPTFIVPLAEDDAELPKNGITGKCELVAVAVAPPTEDPAALLVPDEGAEILAEVVLCAAAVVPLDAKPVLTTPAADWVPT